MQHEICMKSKIKYIFLSSIIFLVSCGQKQKQSYELADLSNPLLEEWFANFKAADSTFSEEKFKGFFYSEEVEECPEEWFSYDYVADSACCPWLIYSPNRKFYLDLDFYSSIDDAIGDDIYMGGDVDTKTTLVDVQNNKKIDIIRTNTYNSALDAFWVNDSVFVMLCQDFDWDSNEYYPYISIWNRANIIGYYEYDGKINNFQNDKFSPFNKRLQRFGVTKIYGYNVIIHYVEPKETLYSIAKQYGISQEELIENNPELKNSTLQAEQQLIIPLNE